MGDTESALSLSPPPSLFPFTPLPPTLPFSEAFAGAFRQRRRCSRQGRCCSDARNTVQPKELNPVKRRSVIVKRIAKPAMAIGQSVRASMRQPIGARERARADWSPLLKAYVHGESFLGSVSISALCITLLDCARRVR